MKTNRPLPIHLLIETTTRCNLRCQQCARLVEKYALADLEFATFERLRPLFPHLQEVALYGHGETFLHKQFFTMLEELKEHGIFVYVTTNGMLVTEKVAEQLVDLQLDRVSFSLDAATPELFNTIRRGADLATILANIRRLNALKKRARRDDRPVLSIMFCAMRSNIQELPNIVRLADELNMLHGVAVLNIVEYGEMHGEQISRYPELAARYFQEAADLAAKLAVPFDLAGPLTAYVQPVHVTLWDRVYRNYREFRRSFNRPALLNLKLARLKARRWKPTEAPPQVASNPQNESSGKMIRVKNCRDPWEFMFVNVHGDVRVCCVSHRIMGNVITDDVTAIWENAPYQAFRAQILTTNPPEECVTCPMRGWHEIPV